MGLKPFISNAFGRNSSKVWRAFLTAVPSRLFGVITLPLVGWITDAYTIVEFSALLKAVSMYSIMGFAWALLVEFHWLRIKNLLKGSV